MVFKIIGFYSLDEFSEPQDNSSMLRCIKSFTQEQLINSQFNLNDYDTSDASTFVDQNQMFFGFLRYLKDKKVLKTNKNPRFVTTEMTLSLFTESMHVLKMSAVLSDGFIFVSAYTESELTDSARRMQLKRMQFLKLMQSKVPGFENQQLGDSDARNRFVCVSESRIDTHTVLFCRTVDGIRTREKTEKRKSTGNAAVKKILNTGDNYLVNLHTIPATSESPHTIRKEKATICSQAILLGGLNKIVFGNYDESGKIKSLNEVDLTTLAVDDIAENMGNLTIDSASSPESRKNLLMKTLTEVETALVEKAARVSLKYNLPLKTIPTVQMNFKRIGEKLISTGSADEGYLEMFYGQCIRDITK